MAPASIDEGVQPSMGVRLETDFDAFFEREDAAAQLQHWREEIASTVLGVPASEIQLGRIRRGSLDLEFVVEGISAQELQQRLDREADRLRALFQEPVLEALTHIYRRDCCTSKAAPVVPIRIITSIRDALALAPLPSPLPSPSSPHQRPHHRCRRRHRQQQHHHRHHRYRHYHHHRLHQHKHSIIVFSLIIIFVILILRIPPLCLYH
ncbi:unnamed protein product [Symbiodinium sp. CCMP2592]|nr:unnamed protein product [Symbiodinium sp. CCMP2592]